MNDQSHKLAIVQTIHQLQLDQTLLTALEDAQQAQFVIDAVDTLLVFSQQWN